jgi:hypothetical protein
MKAEGEDESLSRINRIKERVDNNGQKKVCRSFDGS